MAEITANISIAGVGNYTTPISVSLPAGTYSMTATYSGASQTQSATVVSGQTTRVDFNFLTPKGTLEIHAFLT